eukprot:scaffold919_cov74-Cyclotella_meneghiniana.AAC.4
MTRTADRSWWVVPWTIRGEYYAARSSTPPSFACLTVQSKIPRITSPPSNPHYNDDAPIILNQHDPPPADFGQPRAHTIALNTYRDEYL